MMQGSKLLETIRTLPPGGGAAVVLRHAARFPIADPSEPTLAEITPAGAAAAESFGAQITGFDELRIFHSPVKRCAQTAENIARGAGRAGLRVNLVGAHATLGVDYIKDPVEVGRMNTLHGEKFVRLWFSGRVPEAAILPAVRIATAKVNFLAERLKEPGKRGRRLDLHVTHDWNVIILRELMLNVRHEEAGWLNYLDGVAISWQAGDLRAVYRDRTVVRPLPWRFD